MSKKILVLAIAVFAITPILVFGATIKTGENYYLDAGVVISDNLYAAGGTVGISGTVYGDVLAVGGSIIVSGPVSGDVMVAGGNVNINSDVAGDIRAAGGNITVSKTAGGDLILAGGQINVMADSFFGKDVKIGGGSVNFLGKASRTLDIKGGTVYVNGPVGGNLKIMAEEIRLGPNALIGGNFDYSSVKEAVLEQGAVVSGTTNFSKVSAPAKLKDINAKTAKGMILGFIGVAWVVKTLMFIIAGLVLIYLFKPQTKAVLDRSVLSFWKEALRGFIILVVLPIAVVLSFITVIGTFLGLIAMFFYIAFIAMASVFCILLFAKLCLKFLFKKPDYELNWWVVIISAFVFGIICMIPFVGWIIGFIIFLASLGSVSAFVYNKIRS